jgi:hypothetical protein
MRQLLRQLGLCSNLSGFHSEAERLDPDALRDTPEAMKAMFKHYDHRGLMGNPLTLRAILKREPRMLRVYFAELAAERTRRTLSSD